MRIVQLETEGEIRPEIYENKIIVPNAKEFNYLLNCSQSWGGFGSTREDFNFKRGRARLQYRPVNQVKIG